MRRAWEPLAGCAIALVVIAPAWGATAQQGADQVVSGAKKVGRGVEETAKGIGTTVSEGAAQVGTRAKAAGREMKPSVDRLHDEAKGFGQAIWNGMRSVGRSLERFFTGR